MIRRYLFSRWFSRFDVIAFLAGFSIMYNVNVLTGMVFIFVAVIIGSMLEPTP